MKRAAFVPLALVSAQAAALPVQLESGVWHCPVTEALRCDAGRDCVPGATNLTILVDPAASRIARCWNDLSDCDYHAARFWRRGEQLTAQGSEDGNLVNLSPDLAVTEVSSIGHSVFVFRGRCVQGPAPTAATRSEAHLPVVAFVVPGREVTSVILPGSAVLSDGRGTFVYLLDGNDRVVRRDVVTGQASDRGVAILQGLEGDERIVHAAGPFLNPGEKVRPERAQPAR